MSLNFNTQPYHDDFEEDKNFHKILFKPGVAVQARELTQSQTILQDQIGKLGKFVLSDGSKVNGGRYFVDTNALSLKLVNSNDLATNIQYFSDLYIVGTTSGCLGIITDIDVVNYYLTVKPIINISKNFSSGETLNIFSSKDLAIQSLSNSSLQTNYTATLETDTTTTVSGCNGTLNSTEFYMTTISVEVGDVLSIQSSNNPYDKYVVTEITSNGVFVNKPLDESYSNVTITVTKFASRYIMEIGFDSGVYFTNNNFVKALPQTTIPNLKTQYPSCVIGYEVVETIVDFVDDTSLLDPAQGSNNYTAPGADRYKIYLKLVSKPFVSGEIQNLTDNKFIELLRIKDGKIVSDTTGAKLGAIEDILARQMYDHAGNFVVKDFNLSFHDSDFSESASTMQAEISPGKAYVFGYEFTNNSPQFFQVKKGRDVATSLNNEMSMYYGNRISITNPFGEFLNAASSAKVELHSTDTVSANSSTLVGYAFVRNLKQVSDSEYYLNLYNVSALDISAVKSVVKPTGLDYNTKLFSANTVLTNGVLPVVDSTYNSLLYQLPYNYVSSLSNVQFSTDIFDTVTVSANSATLHTNSLNKIFSAGTGTLSTELKKSTFVIVAQTTNGAYSAGEYIDLSNVSIVVQQGISEYTATITFTNGYNGQIGIKYAIDILSATPKTKTEQSGAVSAVDAKISPTSLGIADISKFLGVFYTPYSDNQTISVTYNGSWSSSTTYSKYNVVLVGEELFVSNEDNNLNIKPDNVNPQWSKLENVTPKYNLNNGQTEAIYDHGYISAKSFENEKQVFVLFNYYTHSSTGDYISYASYPTQYSQIPKHNINAKTYDIRNYFDFRPRRTNNAPSYSFDTYQIPSTLFDGIFFDMQYYLGRIDKLILTDAKKFQWLIGVPSYTNYVQPADMSNAMTIATVQINPYTASPSEISITYKKHKRYTMDDIGNLDTRLSNVEYYTSLNMVEKDVMSRNIYDTTTGERMTNGFVVDPFIGYGTMSIADNYFNCSLDLENQILRPSFKCQEFNPRIESLNGLNEKNGIISFGYSEIEFINQFSATSTENCNPFDVISYSGDFILSPQSDNWVDTENKPIINIVNADTEALSTALSVPGQVYNDWNTFYSTRPYTVESDKLTNVTVQNDTNRVTYGVGTALVKQSDTVKELASNIIPFARSSIIRFSASNLAPLTKMYVYINGRLVNGYVTPSENPIGKIETATITNRGSGYSSSNTIVSIQGANTSTATISVEVFSGTISSAEFTSKGSGYSPQTPNTAITNITYTISGTGSNASFLLSTTPVLGSDLYSNEFGNCSGSLIIPNDDILKFPSGELHLVICDNPNYDFNSCASKAEATFFSSGKSVVRQQTITSIREPYITVVNQDNTPSPTQGAKIIAQDVTYIVRNDIDNIPYTSLQTGTISIPIYLNKKPNSSVTVSWVNALTDQSANTTYSISPSTLTFTTMNWNTPQLISIPYNLGAKQSVDLDNHLFSYLEFYGSSTDSGYNYTGPKPAKSWLNTNLTGVTYSKLIAESKRLNSQIAAKISCSSILDMRQDGLTDFIVTPSGSLLTEYLPITFTVSSSNTSVCTINGIIPPNSSIIQNTNTITVSNIQDFKDFRVRLKFGETGQSSSTITVTSTSGASYWNGVVGTTPFNHISTVPTINPAIVISSSSLRQTTEDGGTTDVYFHLSKQPSQDVYVFATSSDTTEGTITGKRQNGTTLVPGNTMVVFTSSDWSTDKGVQVTGVADSVIDGNITYSVNLSTSSVNSSWNGLTNSVNVVNLDKTISIPGKLIITLSSSEPPSGGKFYTTTLGGTVTATVSLSKQPASNVTISTSVNPSTIATVTAGASLTFTPLNWNVGQPVVFTGGSENQDLVNYPYAALFGSSDATNFPSEIINLINKVQSKTRTVLTPITNSTYTVVSDLDPDTWVPEIASVEATLLGFGGGLKSVKWNATNEDPTWRTITEKITDKSGVGMAGLSVVVQGDEDDVAGGWVQAQLKIILAPGTQWTSGFPTHVFDNLTSLSEKFVKYDNYAQNKPSGGGYSVVDKKTKGQATINILAYEQDAKINDINYFTRAPFHGWTVTPIWFAGLTPEWSYYNTKVVETKTISIKTEVFDSISNQLISSTISHSETLTNTVWEFNITNKANKLYSQGAYDALKTWLAKFPSTTHNAYFGSTEYDALIEYLNTLKAF